MAEEWGSGLPYTAGRKGGMVGEGPPYIASRDEGIGDGAYMALIQSPHPCPLACEFWEHPSLPLDFRCGRAGGFGQQNEAY